MIRRAIWNDGEASAVISVVAASFLSGCTIYRTPDGHSLWSANGPGTVREILGEPDMIEESQLYAFGGASRLTTYTYLDRGYHVRFTDGRVRGVKIIAETERPDYERRVRAFQEEIPKIKLGDTASEIIARLGSPDCVWVGYYKDKMLYITYEGPYHHQFDESPPADVTYALWKNQYIFMVLRDGRVTKVRPLTNWDLEHQLRDQPAEK